MKRLAATHLCVGLLSLLTFLLTGQYMHWFLNHLQGVPDGPRFFLRSCHIHFALGVVAQSYAWVLFETFFNSQPKFYPASGIYVYTFCTGAFDSLFLFGKPSLSPYIEAQHLFGTAGGLYSFGVEDDFFEPKKE